MTTLDLLVSNGLVSTPDGEHQLDVGVAGGRIVALYERGAAPPAERTIDASGLRVLPGFIDAHFHCSGVPDGLREDMPSATAAAAAGGTTTVLHMPVFEPFTIRARAEAAQSQSHVDMAFWGLGGATREEVYQAADEGAIGYKIFMLRPTDDTPGRAKLQVGSGVEFVNALELVASTGRRAAVHCEDQWIIDAIQPVLEAAGRKDPLAHQASRPPVVEISAVAKALALAEYFKARIHITHISTNGVVPLLAEAKRRGVNVSAETCTHYLWFTSEIMKTAGPFSRITPPIRAAEESDALWPAVRDGTIDMVSSDHAPWPLAGKLLGWDDIFLAPNGAPGVELRATGVLTGAASGMISFQRAVEALSASCARAFDLYPRKGAIVPGADADLVLFDLERRWEVKADEMITGARDVARMFDGMRMTGRITETILRGRTIYRDGKVVGSPGDGRPVMPVEPREAAIRA
jgi:dihydroorotase (multifunctional complex type)